MMNKWERVGAYLTKYADPLVFDQFQAGYLKREGIHDFMKDVPVPMSAEDVVNFHTQKGLDVMQVVKNMICVIGINPEFPYVESYLKYIQKYFDQNIVEAIIRDGEQRAQAAMGGGKEPQVDTAKLEEALIYFRAALVMDPKQKHGLFDYGLACRQLAETDSDDEAYRGAMKADSIEAFEELAVIYPDFGPAYYYLGYIYLNMGLYTKALLVFKMFLDLTADGGNGAEMIDSETLKEQRSEIEDRIRQLEEPTKIEAAVNHILAGRPEAGLAELEKYVGGPYDTWWPMHYYLGEAYISTAQFDKAIEAFKRVLQLNPSHAETMNALAEIYEARGEAEQAEKYRKKAEIVKG